MRPSKQEENNEVEGPESEGIDGQREHSCCECGKGKIVINMASEGEMSTCSDCYHLIAITWYMLCIQETPRKIRKQNWREIKNSIEICEEARKRHLEWHCTNDENIHLQAKEAMQRDSFYIAQEDLTAAFNAVGICTPWQERVFAGVGSCPP